VRPHELVLHVDHEQGGPLVLDRNERLACVCQRASPSTSCSLKPPVDESFALPVINRFDC
jgi:hypothetical protein